MYLHVSPNKILTLILLFGFSALLFLSSCSNQKNTALTRAYHSINTRYNAHFNAEEAYKEALKNKEMAVEDNLSDILYIYPDNSDTAQTRGTGANFTTTIDKTTKAIKLHSIKAKPKKDPNKRNDANYQAWLQQKEFNPFLKNTWLLLAKAEFQNGDYLRAITTFMYVSKIYGSQPVIVGECQLWIARAYTEMGWMYEAANIFHKIELAGGVPDKLKGLYATVYANYLVRNKEYEKAIPQLEIAIKKEGSKHQKLRMKYLLGQLYTELGNNEMAVKAFDKVPGMNTPYNFSFNAELRKIELMPQGNKEKALSSLTKMTKNSRNKEYLDQIYFAIGNIYLNEQDTIKATENYNKAVKESTRNGYDKVIAQVALGDIYFRQGKYILAQPCYSDAVTQLSKSDEDYPRVALRSEVLDALVVHVKTVEEQDSLQYVAKLPELERTQLIEGIIADLKKKEEEQKKEEERLQKMQEREDRYTGWDELGKDPLFESKTPVVQPGSTVPQGVSSALFYFYSKQAVDQGKLAFQRQWGNRKLEDNWRRRNKAVSTFDDMGEVPSVDELIVEGDPLKEGDKGEEVPVGEEKTVSEDVYSIEYYLQNLPFTEKAVKESNELIENALFNMGKIYKDKLEDFSLAVDAFDKDLNRFPQTPNKEEIYYQLLLIYMQLNNRDMMALYRNKLLADFPNGKYSTPLMDNNYEWNFKHLATIQDSLYDATYNAYLAADIKTVRNNYQDLKTKYPFGDLMPKFMLLDALTYAQTREVVKLRDNLKTLVETYPQADVTPLATDILAHIKDGKVLLADGTPIRGMDWSGAFVSDSTLLEGDSINLNFDDNLDTEYLVMLVYKEKSIDRNELLYQVADYNFSNYVVHTFDLAFETESPTEMLQIRGFESFSVVRSYLNKAFQEGGLISKLDTSITIIPISLENNKKLLSGQTIDQYIAFFEEQYASQFPQLIAYWNGHRDNLDYLSDNAEAPEEEDDVEEPKPVEQEKKETPVLVVEQPKKEPVDTKKEPEGDDKTITLDDALTKDQLESLGKVNDVLDSAEDLISNPVDGIKGLFNKYKESKNLTKEEKEARKEEEKQEKERLKQLKAIQKAQQDSIRRVEKIRQDSISAAEKAVQDSIKQLQREKEQEEKRIEQERKDAIKAAAKAKEDARKQREQERKEKERQQKERLKQREQERKEKLKAQEKARKEQEKQMEERRKQQNRKRE